MPPLPRILGIVNITADSFSDGGRYLDPDAAIAHATDLIDAGADAVDLGPASTHPDAEVVSSSDEIRRLSPVISALHARRIPVSVDSFHPDTQRWALQQGVATLNDIQGFPDPSMYPLLAASDATLIAMFSIQSSGGATRIHTEAADIVARITAFFDTRIAALVAAGVRRERLVLDPGMGFFLGADPEPSVAVLRALPVFRARYELPILISVSRKSFLRRLTGAALPDIGPATLAAELYAAAAGADWIRTHDVGALRDGLRIQAALRPSGG